VYLEDAVYSNPGWSVSGRAAIIEGLKKDFALDLFKMTSIVVDKGQRFGDPGRQGNAGSRHVAYFREMPRPGLLNPGAQYQYGNATTQVTRSMNGRGVVANALRVTRRLIEGLVCELGTIVPSSISQ